MHSAVASPASIQFTSIHFNSTPNGVVACQCTNTSSTGPARVCALISRSEAILRILFEVDRKLSTLGAHLSQHTSFREGPVLAANISQSTLSAALDSHVPQPSGFLAYEPSSLLLESSSCMRSKKKKTSYRCPLLFRGLESCMFSNFSIFPRSLHTPHFGLITNRESSECGVYIS